MKKFLIFVSFCLTLSSMVLLGGCKQKPLESDTMSFDDAYQTFVDQQLQSDFLQTLVKFSQKSFYEKEGTFSVEATHPAMSLSLSFDANSKGGYDKKEKTENVLENLLADLVVGIKGDLSLDTADAPFSGSANIAGTIALKYADMIGAIKLTDPVVALSPTTKNEMMDQTQAQISSFLQMFKDKRYTLDIKEALPYQQMKEEMGYNNLSMIKIQSILLELPSKVRTHLRDNTLLVQVSTGTVMYDDQPAYLVSLDPQVVQSTLQNVYDESFSQVMEEVIPEEELNEVQQDIEKELSSVATSVQEIQEQSTNFVTGYLIPTTKGEVILVIEAQYEDNNGEAQGLVERSPETISIQGQIKDPTTDVFASFEGEGNMETFEGNVTVTKTGDVLATVDFALDQEVSSDMVKGNMSIEGELTKDALTLGDVPESFQDDLTFNIRSQSVATSISKPQVEIPEDAVSLMDMFGGMGMGGGMPMQQPGVAPESMQFDDQMSPLEPQGE